MRTISRCYLYDTCEITRLRKDWSFRFIASPVVELLAGMVLEGERSDWGYINCSQFPSCEDSTRVGLCMYVCVRVRMYLG